MNKSFALTAQRIMILILLVSFVMMAQTISHEVFVAGLTLLIVTALCQIAVGNIDLSLNGRRWLRSFISIFIIIEQVVLISLLVSPLFLSRQFVTAFLLMLIIGTTGFFLLFILRGTGCKE